MASKRESLDPQKPPRGEQELQPMAEPNDAVTRDITGEEHPNPSALRQPDTDVYLVREGDSLAKIAKRFYGSEKEYMRILNANRDRLGENDELTPGEELRIPPKD